MPARLIIGLLLSWGVMGVTGVALQVLVPLPSIAIAISRGYCPPQAWQALSDRYASFYNAHQQQQLQIRRVYLISDLGEEQFESPPTPAEISQLRPFGRSPEAKLATLSQQETGLEILSCQSEGAPS